MERKQFDVRLMLLLPTLAIILFLIVSCNCNRLQQKKEEYRLGPIEDAVIDSMEKPMDKKAPKIW